MSRNLLAEPPITHQADPEAIGNELDYGDMIALSGMFRRWALYEEGFSPEGRTRLMLWSADFERIAAWVGDGWRATDPPERPLLKFLATLERDASRAINLRNVKHWMGLT
jgi:hypothetical protein